MTRKSQQSISKILSKNDVGETGSHMAGILIPKQPTILEFFPPLELNALNPRVEVVFIDSSGETWTFNFLHYNNRFYGGTRNEYRLTGMTKYIKSYSLTEGDEIIFKKRSGGTYSIAHRRNTSKSSTKDVARLVSDRTSKENNKAHIKNQVDSSVHSSDDGSADKDVLILGDSWRVVRLRK